MTKKSAARVARDQGAPHAPPRPNAYGHISLRNYQEAPVAQALKPRTEAERRSRNPLAEFFKEQTGLS